MYSLFRFIQWIIAGSNSLSVDCLEAFCCEHLIVKIYPGFQYKTNIKISVTTDGVLKQEQFSAALMSNASIFKKNSTTSHCN